MDPFFLRKFSTAGPDGDGRQAYLNEDGVFLGRGVPLLERDAQGRWKPRDAGVLAGLLSKGYGVPVELGWREGRLRHIADALNKGDLVLAGVSLVYLELPPLPSDGHARAMAQADGLLVKFNPHWDRQQRDPKGAATGGRWTSDGQYPHERRAPMYPQNRPTLVSQRVPPVPPVAGQGNSCPIADPKTYRTTPNAKEQAVLNLPAVRQAMKTAVDGSHFDAADNTNRTEQGFTVFLDRKNKIRIVMATPMKDSLGFFSLTRYNPGQPGWKNLALFHTHPFTGMRPDGMEWKTEPDCEVVDVMNDQNFKNVVNIIQAPNGVRYYFGG
jgi:hypothetical protein